MGKRKAPSWWKMFYHQRAVLDSISDVDVGAGLKAAFKYFDGEAVSPADLTPGANTAFIIMKPYLDESRDDYIKSVESGKKGGAPAHKKRTVL